jgi:hypothetical protein
VTCPPQVIPSGNTRGVIVFSAASKTPEWTGTVRVVGKASINGQEVVRELRAGGPTYAAANNQQAATTFLISRLSRDLVLGVRDEGPYSVTATAKETAVLPGKNVTVPITLKRNASELKSSAIKLTPVNLSKDLTLATLTVPAGKDTQDISIAVKTNAPPGLYTVVLLAEADVDMADSKTKKKAKIKLLQPSTPILFTVLPSQLGKLKATAAGTKLTKGQNHEIIVSVSRMYDYDGPFTVKLASKSKGISAKEVTIPAGASEAKVMVQVAPDAVLSDGGLTFQAVALFQGQHPVTHEAKLTVTLSSK